MHLYINIYIYLYEGVLKKSQIFMIFQKILLTGTNLNYLDIFLNCYHFYDMLYQIYSNKENLYYLLQEIGVLC